MENLAGVKKCGPVIQKELKAAGIIKLRRIPKLQKNCEVPSPFKIARSFSSLPEHGITGS